MIITRQLTDTVSASTASDIQLGSCVTEIGQGAFSGYTNLTDVEFPDSLTTIGVGAFSGSSITSVEFPDNLETIGDSAFGGCYGLETIDIPDSVTTIGNYAFNFPMQGESLTECTIGSGVTSIGNGAFDGNTNMRKLTINATTPPTLGNSSLNGSYLIYVPYSSYDDYISASGWVNYKNRIVYNDFPYKAMFLNGTGGSENFVPCNESSILTRDEVVNTITTAVTKVILGNCINTVGDSRNSVFSDYTSLNEIEFSDSITAITDSAFARTNAHITTLPSSVATIGGSAFSGTDATVKISFDSLTIGNDITSIGYGAFKNCSIGTLNLTSTATTYGGSYGGGIFSNTNITNLNIGNTVTKISPFMFVSSSGFTSLTIPNSVATIEDNAFVGCHDLKTLIINGNTAISNYGFESCPSLSSVTMPNVTQIGKGAFESCSSLKKINPNSTYDAVINLSVIKNWAFEGNAFETLELGANVTSVSGRTFASNTNLKKLHIIGNNSTIFGVEVESSPVSYHGAFENCTALEEVIIDNAYSFNNRNMLVFAFTNCNAIKKITIGSGYSSIDNGLFQGKTSLTSLTLSNGITSIGERAFNGCTSLGNVDFPNTLTSIGASAFTNCSGMTTLIIPDSVISIGNNAFQNCSGLTSILVGRSTPPTIGTNVFNGSNCLIYVPQASYDLYVNAENWSVYADRIYAVGQDYKALLMGGTNKVVNCNDNTTLAMSEIGSNSATTINIGNCVTAIGDSAFTSSTNVQTVSIPSGVTSIGNRVFYNRRTLTTVSGMQGVETIGDYAFQGCSGLTSISFSDDLTSIGYGAFSGCSSLGGVTLPSTVSSISNNAFKANLEYIKLTSTTPPELVLEGQYYENYCFGQSGSTAYPIYVPCSSYEAYLTAWDGYNQIKGRIVPFGDYTKTEEVAGEYVCENGDKYKKMEVFVSSDNVTWCSVGYHIGDLIESGAIDCTTFLHVEWNNNCGTNCNLSGYSYTKLCGEATSTTVTSSDIPYSKDYVSAVTIGDCVTEIGNQAFTSTMIKSVEIPNSVTSISEYAFRMCPLTALTIPSSVVSIGEEAFYQTSANTLTSVVVNAETPPTLGSNVFNSYYSNSSNKFLFYVPAASVDAYKAASGWSKYADRIQSIETFANKFEATYTDGASFSVACDATTTLTTATTKAPASSYVNMKTAVIKNCVETISAGAFSGFTNLTSVTISSGVTSISNSAFTYCTSLTSVTIPNSVTSIGNSAFQGCSGLTSVIIGNSLTSIGSNTFSYCRSLTSINIPSSVTSIGEYAFYACDSLISVTVNAKTPPTLGYNTLGSTNNCPIFVPSTSVDVYKAASGWSTYADRFQPIPNS